MRGICSCLTKMTSGSRYFPSQSLTLYGATTTLGPVLPAETKAFNASKEEDDELMAEASASVRTPRSPGRTREMIGVERLSTLASLQSPEAGELGYVPGWLRSSLGL